VRLACQGETARLFGQSRWNEYRGFPPDCKLRWKRHSPQLLWRGRHPLETSTGVGVAPEERMNAHTCAAHRPSFHAREVTTPVTLGSMMAIGLTVASRIPDQAPDPGGQRIDCERLGDHLHAGIEEAVGQRGILGVARDEQHLEVRPRDAHLIRELATVDSKEFSIGRSPLGQIEKFRRPGPRAAYCSTTDVSVRPALRFG